MSNLFNYNDYIPTIFKSNNDQNHEKKLFMEENKSSYDENISAKGEKEALKQKVISNTNHNHMGIVSWIEKVNTLQNQLNEQKEATNMLKQNRDQLQVDIKYKNDEIKRLVSMVEYGRHVYSQTGNAKGPQQTTSNDPTNDIDIGNDLQFDVNSNGIITASEAPTGDATACDIDKGQSLRAKSCGAGVQKCSDAHPDAAAQMKEMVDKFKADIVSKNEELGKNQEEISKLQACLAEEKVNNDGLTNKVQSLEDESKVFKAAEEKSMGKYESLKAEKDKQAEDYMALQASSTAKTEEFISKIDKLENVIKTLQAEADKETKSNAMKVGNLDKQIEDLNNCVNEQNEIAAKLTQELTDAQQEIEKYKNNERVLSELPTIIDEAKCEVDRIRLNEIPSLQAQLSAERKSNGKIVNDLEKQIEHLQEEIQEKDGKFKELQDGLNAKETLLAETIMQIGRLQEDNDRLNFKVESLEEKVDVIEEAEEKSKVGYEAFKAEKDKQAEDYAALQASSIVDNGEAKAKIEKLGNEMKTLQDQMDEEGKSNEERVGNLEKHIEDLQNIVNGKNENLANLTQKLFDAQQKIEKYKNNEQALGLEIAQLKDQIAAKQDLLNNKDKEHQETVGKIKEDLQRQIQEKDAKLAQVQNNLNAKESELISKIQGIQLIEQQLVTERELFAEARKQNAIRKASDDKLIAELRRHADKSQEDKVRLQKELQDKEKEFAEYRTSPAAKDKQARQSIGDWEPAEHKYQQDIVGYTSQIDTPSSTQSTLESNLEEEESDADDEKRELLPTTNDVIVEIDDNSGCDTADDIRSPDDIIGDNLEKYAQGWVLRIYAFYQFMVSIALLVFMEDEDNIFCVVVLWIFLASALLTPLGMYLSDKNRWTDFWMQYCILFALILPVELGQFKSVISGIFGDANSIGPTKAMAVIFRGIAMGIWMIIRIK